MCKKIKKYSDIIDLFASLCYNTLVREDRFRLGMIKCHPMTDTALYQLAGPITEDQTLEFKENICK